MLGLSGCDIISDLLDGNDPPDEDKAVTFTVTFNGNGGIWPPNEESSVTTREVPTKDDGTVNLPGELPSKTNKYFAMWNTQPDGLGSPVTGSTVVSADTTVYAQWQDQAGGSAISETGTQKDFGFLNQTGDDNIQTFTVQQTGRYKFELWGARGGKGHNTTTLLPGGYASGSLVLTAGTTLHLYVGGRGADGTTQTSGNSADTGGAGGWNGGGSGGNSKVNTYKGGGGNCAIRDADYMGGSGGGPIGGNGTVNTSSDPAPSGTQTGGYSFGIGESAADSSSSLPNHYEGRGGGGGYWGGQAVMTATNSYYAGGGGSGFVYGYDQTPGVGGGKNWIPAEYQSYVFTGDFACIAGDQLANQGKQNPDTNGNGFIRITFMSE